MIIKTLHGHINYNNVETFYIDTSMNKTRLTFRFHSGNFHHYICKNGDHAETLNNAIANAAMDNKKYFILK